MLLNQLEKYYNKMGKRCDGRWGREIGGMLQGIETTGRRNVARNRDSWQKEYCKE